jgi:hypothetical protein
MLDAATSYRVKSEVPENCCCNQLVYAINSELTWVSGRIRGLAGAATSVAHVHLIRNLPEYLEESEAPESW